MKIKKTKKKLTEEEIELLEDQDLFEEVAEIKQQQNNYNSTKNYTEIEDDERCFC